MHGTMNIEYNIKVGLKRNWKVVVGWTDVAHYMYKWQSLVNTILNLWVLCNAGSFLTT